MKLGELVQWTAELAGFDEVPADSQVYLDSEGDVRRVLFGVDTSIAELMFAKQAGYDALVAHHPLGELAVTGFPQVVQRQVEQMASAGIEKSLAQAAIATRLDRPHRARHMSNINALVDTGRLVGLPFCNIHLACDEICRQLLVERLAAETTPDATVGDAIQALNGFAEIRNGFTRPEAWVGAEGNPLGRWVVAMAGGTNGGYPVFSEYWKAGISTIFAMHCAEDDLAKLRAHAEPNQNLVVTGHMATDSIGINHVIAAMEERGIEVTRTSGIVPPSGK